MATHTGSEGTVKVGANTIAEIRSKNRLVRGKLENTHWKTQTDGRHDVKP